LFVGISAAFVRRAIIVILIVAAISDYRSYRVRAAAEAAARFKPTVSGPVFVPAGTAIQAVLWNGVPALATRGDFVAAHVPMPVIVDGNLLIPDGAWLNGELEEFVVSDSKAWANIRFTQLVIRDRSFSVQTRRVVFVIPVQSDIQILGTILKTLVGAGLGAAVGADTGDKRLLDSGLRVGVVSSVFSGAMAPVSIVLVRGVTVER
jgi:hypothetical protein